MNKYEQGKIYKLVNSVNDMIYIGSTTEPLHKRWVSHLTDYKRRPNNKLYTKIREIGIEHFKIILLSIYPCESKSQLVLREREEYDKYDIKKLLNTYRPKVSEEEMNQLHKQCGKQYYERTKEHYLEVRKNYYNENKKTINKKNREYWNKNKDKLHEKNKEWRMKHVNEKNEYDKHRYNNTKLLKLLPLYDVSKNEKHLYF